MKKIHCHITQILLVLVLILNGTGLSGQDKTFSIQDVSLYNGSLYPGSLSNLQWMGNSDYFSFVADNKLVMARAGSAKYDTVLTVDDLNCALNKIEEDSLKRFPYVKALGDNILRFSHNNRLFIYDIRLEQLREMNNYQEGARNIEIEENTFAVAYTIDNNLYIALEGKQVQVTYEDDKNIISGQTVHRNEFGISDGIFWSPKGNYLAFYRKDESKVRDYPVVDIKKRMAEIAPVKYPMAGMDSEAVTLGVYNVASGKTVFLQTGEPSDQYLTSVTWGPSEEFIYIALLNRDQNHLKLNKYDVTTGELIKTLFEESHENYVEPENPLYFLHKTPDLFIWQSERNGYNHLYLYDIDGTMVKQLTDGEWVVRELLGTDPRDAHVFFTSTMESPLNNDVYAMDMGNGKISKLSEYNGTHYPKLNRNGKYLIDIFSDTIIARRYDILNHKGKLLQTLQEEKDPLEDYALGEMEIFTLKSDDGVDLYCRMIKPINFDPGRKYPAIVYVYGGPHAQLVTNSWLGGAGLFLNFLAQQGYVVFTLDNRGSANRGLEFEQAVFRNLGTLEVADQMKGVEYLRSLPYVDPERIGVDGWSYGGFMTISLMLKQPDDFKVGVAGGPVTDWKYYEVMYGERYMDTPEQNPEGYKEASLLNHAGKLKGDLLIIHGTSDPVVVWQHSLDLISRFIQEGIQVDYFVYPGHGHGVGGKDRLHLNEKIFKYFQDNL